MEDFNQKSLQKKKSRMNSYNFNPPLKSMVVEAKTTRRYPNALKMHGGKNENMTIT